MTIEQQVQLLVQHMQLNTQVKI